ncbi:hypothetical protein MNBD_GAMMA25-2629 [hydrothermal vent metagenome]|uniref:PEP-CTERM protein-sorting domain-containing protein n=1 Tax=hydrothermal vent metagenome TaxID=652676 RepID=A0A3B1B5Y8_9ZZZZ
MKFVSYAGMSALILLGNMNLAQAISYSVVGSFENQGFSDPYSLSYLFNNDSADLAEFGWGVNLASYESSRFQFDGVNADAELPLDSSLLINLGSFTYTNLETVLVGDVVTVDLGLAVNVFGAGQTKLTYALEVNNTDNVAAGSDSMRVINSPENVIFTVDGSDYELLMLGFSIDGGNSFESNFNLAEGASLNMGIYVQLDRVSAVPVPAAVWLFGSALLGLAGIARRKH